MAEFAKKTKVELERLLETKKIVILSLSAEKYGFKFMFEQKSNWDFFGFQLHRSMRSIQAIYLSFSLRYLNVSVQFILRFR